MAKHTNFAYQIIEKMGGKENISKVYHCFTRLRFTVFDDSKVQIKEIQKIKGHLGIKKQSGQYQIIIGKEVADVYKKISKQLDIISESIEPSNNFAIKGKKSIKFNPNSIIDVVASLFTPILGVIAGAGIFQGIFSIFTSTNIVTGDNAAILNLIGGSAMAILPILLAATTAKKFNVNIYLAMTVAGVLIAPTIITNISPDKNITNYLYLWGMPIPVLSYGGAVFPSILMVITLFFVEKGLERVLPKIIRFILLPFFALVVMVPLTLIAFGPVGNYIGIGIASFVEILFSWQPWIAGAIYGLLRPFTIIFGMHYAFFPVILSNLASAEARDVLLPIHLLTNYALAGGALGALFIIKNKQEKQIATAATISGLFGITEPSLYGIMLKNKMTFAASLITSMVMGGVVAGLQIYNYSFAPPSWLTIATFYSGDEPIWKFIVLICLTVLALFMSAGLTMLFGIDEYKNENKHYYDNIKWYQLNKSTMAYHNSLKANKERNSIMKSRYDNGSKIYSSTKGKLADFNSINNPLVDKNALGYLIETKKNEIYAPISGRVQIIGDKNNAFIITDEKTNIKVLLHFSDSKELDDQFKTTLHIKNDTIVNNGDLLISFDYKMFKSNNINLETYVAVLENPNGLDSVGINDSSFVLSKKKMFLLY